MLVHVPNPVPPLAALLGRVSAGSRRVGSLRAMRIPLPAGDLEPGDVLVRLVPLRRRARAVPGGLLLAARLVRTDAGTALEASGWARAGRYLLTAGTAAVPLRVGLHGAVRVTSPVGLRSPRALLAAAVARLPIARVAELA
ncbi:hypothetical protein QDR37_03810 [Amnibacterium sp. CER49]|uniref:hypothetical protein n=1 Tax=Amnibacterium sp. CER49 TaxID=3039161 RepID=UPI00244C8BE0|nr:hypothetical protein [Amnibacterium sp. CER49]MDH2443067.1 hypothetical protein [Amnibacterium sp. CER49]